MRLVRPSRTALVALLACLALAGCVSSSTAGWTFAPAPSASPPPVASAGAGSSAAAGGSTAPTTSATPGASAAAGAGTADVTISALNVAFEQPSVNAPSGKAFTLLFDNKDASIQHDVYIKDAGGTDVFEGAIVTGPAQMTYNVPSLAAGSYTFACSIHSTMTGTMVVQ